MHRETERGVPAIQEAQPCVVMASGFGCLPEQTVNDILARVLQLNVTVVGSPARVGELLPVAGAQRGAFPVAVVPGDHRVGGRQLESHRVVVVEIGAHQLILERDAAARREPAVGLAARRPGHLPARHTASSSVSRSTPVNDDITSSRSPGNWMARPVAASSPARDSRQTRGTSTRKYAPSSRTSTSMFSSSMTATTDRANGVV